MNIDVFPAEHLPPEHIALWSQIQRDNPSLHSPFFRPEYTQLLASFRPGIEVAVLRNDGNITGFFPYQRHRRNIGRPVGGLLCDFEGVIVPAGTEWEAKELIKGCGLTAWNFRHLLVSQEPFRPYHVSNIPSLYMDLSRGFEAYGEERRRAGTQQLRKAAQRARKAAREVGPLRFEAATKDRQVFETLLRWKTEHYRRIKATDPLAPEWARILLERLIHLDGENFSGILSALYFGDRLVAAHLGIRSREVLHAWFPTYDAELGIYSPGLLFFLEIAKAAPSLGIERIDLGLSFERFKTSLGSSAVPVAQGTVDLRPITGRLSRGVSLLADRLRKSALRIPARAVNRAASRLFRKSESP